MLKLAPQPWKLSFAFEREQIEHAMAQLQSEDHARTTCFIARSMTDGKRSGNMSRLLAARDDLDVAYVDDISCYGPQTESLAATGWFSPETPGAFYIFEDFVFVAPFHQGTALADPTQVEIGRPSSHAVLGHLTFYDRLRTAESLAA